MNPTRAVIKTLEKLKEVKAEYPPALLAARRAAFVSQVKQKTCPAGTGQVRS